MSTVAICWSYAEYPTPGARPCKRALKSSSSGTDYPRRCVVTMGPPFASRSAIHGLSRLSAWWVALGINLERGRPGHPQDNGAHERLHRDISRELECFNQEITQQATDLCRDEFNYHRPHESLVIRCPAAAGSYRSLNPQF